MQGQKGKEALVRWLQSEINKAIYLAEELRRGDPARDGEPSVLRWKYREKDLREVLEWIRQEDP